MSTKSLKGILIYMLVITMLAVSTITVFAAKKPGKETIKVTSSVEPETTTVEPETETTQPTTEPETETTQPTTEPETETTQPTTEPETETTQPTWEVEVLPYVKADPLPKTGDNSFAIIMICLMIMCLATVVLIYDVTTKKATAPVEKNSENAEKEVVEEVVTTAKNVEAVNIIEAIIASVATIINGLKSFVVFSETKTMNDKIPTRNIVGRDVIYPEARGGDAALRK